MRLLAPILALLLTGCTGANFSLATAKVEHQVRTDICPEVRPYPKSVQNALITEIQTCTNCTLLIGLAKDYSVMRDQGRICRGH
jgi:hypothetical protein